MTRQQKYKLDGRKAYAYKLYVLLIEIYFIIDFIASRLFFKAFIFFLK